MQKPRVYQKVSKNGDIKQTSQKCRSAGNILRIDTKNRLNRFYLEEKLLATNKTAQQPTQFKNLKSLKNNTLAQIVDFCHTLKSTRCQIEDIGVAISKKQIYFNEKKIAEEQAELHNAKETTEFVQQKTDAAVSQSQKQEETKSEVVAVEAEQPKEKEEPQKQAKKSAKSTKTTKTQKQAQEDETKEQQLAPLTEQPKQQESVDKKAEEQPVKAEQTPAAKSTEEPAAATQQVKTYTDEKGNVKVRRFISDLNNTLIGNNYKANTSKQRTQDGGRQSQQGRKPYENGASPRFGAGNIQGRPSFNKGVSADSKVTKPVKPTFSTEYMPKTLPSKNYGNKNKTPEKSDEKRKNETKKQLLLRTYSGLDEDDEAMLAKRPRGKKMAAATTQPQVIKAIDHAVIATKEVQLKVLSEKTGIPVAQLIKALFKEGIVKTINDSVDFEIASFITESFNVTLEYKPEKTAEEQMIASFDLMDEELQDNEKRPPIVTVMGHVDHGKTSLLDAIRNTNVTAGEAGGITQHIGAYTVKVKGQTITFIDTPGHAAFTAMRARGAKVTDVAIIVVAADDGVMPQTVEAINHAKAADVAIIVAINKMDKPEANPDRVKQQLTEYELVPEEWGGDTIMVPVSAKSGKNLDVLLESVLTVTEIKELKANSNKRASGTIIEAKLDKGRGPVATVLIKNGTLHVGDFVIAGTVTGKIRAMFDDKGRQVKSAGPSYPVEVLGFDDVPMAGDVMHAGDEKNIKAVAAERKAAERENIISANTTVTLGDLFNKISEGELKTLNIIIKTDVQGSLEALRVSLEKLSNAEVKVSSIHGGVGAINETDVMLARASNAIIIGFNVRPDTNAKNMAEKEGVDIRLYRIIYDAVDDITKAMKGMLAPKYKEEIIGQVTVRNVFKISGVGTVAGCYVNSGKITRDSKIRLYRDNVLVTDCQVAALKRFKDDVKEVVAGFECGISLVNYNDIKVDDVYEVYCMTQIDA